MADYVGIRDDNGKPAVARVDGEEITLLQQRTDLFPAGEKPPEWGYVGNGPMRTAVMVLADALKDDADVRVVAVPFMKMIVANLEKGGWTLKDAEVKKVATHLLKAARARWN